MHLVYQLISTITKPSQILTITSISCYSLSSLTLLSQLQEWSTAFSWLKSVCHVDRDPERNAPKFENLFIWTLALSQGLLWGYSSQSWQLLAGVAFQLLLCRQWGGSKPTHSSNVKCLQRVSAVVYLYGVDKRVVVCSSNSDLICYVWTESHATLTDLPWRIRCAPYWFLNSKDMK